MRRDVPLSGYSTLGIGGPARYLATVHDPEDLQSLLDWAERMALPHLIIGEGSNILFPDAGFGGIALRIRIPGKRRHDNEVVVGAGENLGRLIEWVNRQGLQGLERMYGIPGGVAGAVVGNAGAYGQEISQVLTEATILTPDRRVATRPASRLAFDYRHSLFKTDRRMILLNCRLRLHPGAGSLQEESDFILKKRSVKYPPGIKCPGSYFKNVKIEEVDADRLAQIPPSFLMHGKIPAGKLLEAVGANGARRGEAMIATYHGNLILNLGKATARDVAGLAATYSQKVRDRFGIRLIPEIRIIEQETNGHERTSGH